MTGMAPFGDPISSAGLHVVQRGGLAAGTDQATRPSATRIAACCMNIQAPYDLKTAEDVSHPDQEGYGF